MGNLWDMRKIRTGQHARCTAHEPSGKIGDRGRQLAGVGDRALGVEADVQLKLWAACCEVCRNGSQQYGRSSGPLNLLAPRVSTRGDVQSSDFDPDAARPSDDHIGLVRVRDLAWWRRPKRGVLLETKALDLLVRASRHGF